MPVFQRYMSLGAETSYGVAVSPSVDLGMSGESIDFKKDIRLFNPARLLAPNRHVSERATASGAADCFFGFEKLGRVLKSLIGPPATSTVDTGVYQRTF